MARCQGRLKEDMICGSNNIRSTSGSMNKVNVRGCACANHFLDHWVSGLDT